MKKTTTYLIGFVALLLSTLSATAVADSGTALYEVTITNVTRGEIFTPIMVATHNRNFKLFKAGEAASKELESLAESGNTKPLSDFLTQSKQALQVVTTAGPLLAGKSVVVQIKANKRFPLITVTSMLVPSNDAFFAVKGVHVPRAGRTRKFYSPAYDAGSEYNDELCVSIPGPPFICQGEGVSQASGEGYVHIHGGIHGIGDLNAAQHDWRNPVAMITIRKVADE